MSEAPKKIWLDEIVVAGRSSFILLRDEEFASQGYIRADIVEEMREALSLVASTFRFYEGHHEANGAQTKAQMNRELADQMEAALDRLEEE